MTPAPSRRRRNSSTISLAIRRASKRPPQRAPTRHGMAATDGGRGLSWTWRRSDRRAIGADRRGGSRRNPLAFPRRVRERLRLAPAYDPRSAPAWDRPLCGHRREDRQGAQGDRMGSGRGSHGERRVYLASERAHASGLSSGEGLISNVRDPMTERVRKRDGEIEDEDDAAEPDEDGFVTRTIDPGVEDKRLLIVEQEFAQPLRLMRREGNPLSQYLRTLWDSGRAAAMTRHSPLKATNAHVSVLGHIVVEELQKEMHSVDWYNGFANRFLFACVRRSRRCRSLRSSIRSISRASRMRSRGDPRRAGKGKPLDLRSRGAKAMEPRLCRRAIRRSHGDRRSDHGSRRAIRRAPLDDLCALGRLRSHPSRITCAQRSPSGAIATPRFGSFSPTPAAAIPTPSACARSSATARRARRATISASPCNRNWPGKRIEDALGFSRRQDSPSSLIGGRPAERWRLT
jgi:hypothetical protein